MPHERITKAPTTVSELTGLPLADVLDTERCERCFESGVALGIRTYHTIERGTRRVRRLCRACADAAAYEEAYERRNKWAEAEAERLVMEAIAEADAVRRGDLPSTPDDFCPGADAYDRFNDR
jgi:hypothetical protein